MVDIFDVQKSAKEIGPYVLFQVPAKNDLEIIRFCLHRRQYNKYIEKCKKKNELENDRKIVGLCEGNYLGSFCLISC